MFNLIDFANKLGKTTKIPTYVAILIIAQIIVIIALVIFILVDTINAKKEKEEIEQAIIMDEDEKKEALDIEQFEEINNAEIYKKPEPIVEKHETPIANNNDLILNRLINDIGTKSGVAATASMMDHSSNYVSKQSENYSTNEDDDIADDFEDSQDDLEDEKEILSTEVDNNKNVRINKIVIYRKNFIAKMCQAEDDVKELYQELINKLSSYSKIKGKIGNHYDAYKIGNKFDAELEVLASQGIGVRYGWRNAIDDNQNMLNLYTKNSIADMNGNYTNKAHDIVIVSLGTNDNSLWSSYENDTITFLEYYYQLLEMLAIDNPNSYIFCIYGMAGKAANITTSIDIAVEAINDDYENIHAFTYYNFISTQNGHPLDSEHTVYSNNLYSFIQESMAN